MSSVTQPLPIADAAYGAERRPAPFAPLIGVSHIQCHYCGYESATPATSHGRCPKCGSSAWERYVIPGTVLEEEADVARTDVTFTVSCPAVRAYLSCSFEDGTSSVSAMARAYDGSWRVTLSLLPGTYRYHFYVDDGRVLYYWPAEGVDTCGADRVVVVIARHRRGAYRARRPPHRRLLRSVRQTKRRRDASRSRARSPQLRMRRQPV
jgi:hypothetical protein